MAAGFGAVGIGASLVGGLLSAQGAAQQGDAQQKMYNYRAKVAEINANINRQNAAWARDKGEIEGTMYGLKAAQRMGQIKQAQAGSGFDVNTGSNARVRESQSKIAQMDEAQIRDNATKIAYDYETRATMDQNQAQLDIMAGENAKLASKYKVAESIIGTVSTVSSKWQQGKSVGLWS